MTVLKYLLLAILAVVLVVLALANRALVEVKLLPPGLVDLLGFQGRIALPLFLVALGGVVLGLLIGFVWEWSREARLRRISERRHQEVVMLERENSRLRRERHEGEDEVLVLLDQPPAGGDGTGTALART